VTLAALTQIHFAALGLFPILALVLLLAVVHHARQRQLTLLWKPLGIGLGASLLLYTPYLVFDAFIGWRNVKTLLQVSRNPAQIHWEVVRYALLNVGGREIHALAGPQRFREFLQGILHLAYWPDRIQEALLVVSVVYLLVRWWRARRETIPFKRDGLLLLWLTLPVLFFLRGKSPVYPHYLIPLYPAPYLALAIAAVDALQGIARLRTAKGWLYALAALPLAALIAWQSYLSLSIYAFVDRHDTPEGMGTPIRILREAARTIEHYAETWHSEQAVMVCPGDNPQWDECPAVFSFMTDRSLDLRFVDGRASLLFPQSGTDMPIVVAPGAGTVEEQLSHYAQELPAARVALREGVGAYRFYRLPTGTAPQPPVQPAGAPIRLANGVSLLGFQISPSPQPGQVTRLELYWRVEDLPAEPPAQGYSFANHLLAADGQRCGQRDGPGYPVELWRPGDTLISSFDIDVPADAPPGPYTLRVGMYVYTPPDQFATVHVVDAAGQPISSAVEWPLP
jgi:hypothetical protein